MKQEEILEIKKRKEDLQNTVKFLEADIRKYSLEAETKWDLTLLVKANSFRTTKEDKMRQIETLPSSLTKIEGELKELK